MTPTLLVLTPRFPYPVVGGDRLRIYEICKVLSSHFRITLLSLCDSKSEVEMLIPDDGIFHRIERIFLPKWRSYLNCAFALPTNAPLQVAFYKHRAFKKRASELMKQHDACIAHLIRSGDAIKNEPGVKFLEMTDIISLNYSRISDTKLIKFDFRAMVYRLESKRLKSYESKIVNHFDHSFLVSEFDRNFLFGNNSYESKLVSVFSNGVNLDSFPYQFNHNAKDIIFIGNMQSLQNFDAALFMATDIFPLVRKVLPHVRLRLIGRIKPEQALQLSTFIGVDVTGEIDNVANAAKDGAVGVCPLRLGAGVQNKVLEYMSLGLPVVSTSIGLEGFDAQDGKELFVENDPALFAKKIISLIENRNSAEVVSKFARKYVETNHSWDEKLAPMVRLIKDKISYKNSKSAS